MARAYRMYLWRVMDLATADFFELRGAGATTARCARVGVRRTSASFTRGGAPVCRRDAGRGAITGTGVKLVRRI